MEYAFWITAFLFLLMLTSIIWLEQLGYVTMDENTVHEEFSHANPPFIIPDPLSKTIDWDRY